MRRIKLAVAAGAISLVAIAGCDPEEEALKVFTKQGLTLLRPARDYVVAGGIIVWPKNGRPVYVDPLSEIKTDDSKPFNAVLQGASTDKSAEFGLVLGLIHKLLPLDIGLTAGSKNATKLDQIDATGKRLTIPTMNSILKEKTTQAFIHEQLSTGATAFVIQEVYSAKALTLVSTSGGNFSATVQGKSVNDCSKKSEDKKSAESDKSEAGAKPSTGNSPANGTNPKEGGEVAQNTGGASAIATTSSQPTSKPASPPKKEESATSGTTSADKPAESDGATKAPEKPKDSGGIGVCIEKGTTLKFTSANALPILVRLMKVVPIKGAKDNSLMLQLSGFEIPNSLGNAPWEKYTYIDPKNPTIDQLEHRILKK